MIRNAFARLPSVHPGYRHRAAALAAAALLATGFAGAPARASTVAFDNLPAQDTGGWSFGFDEGSAMGAYFVAEASGPISRVVASMARYSPEAPKVTLTLYQWGSVPPDPFPGTGLASASLTLTNVSAAEQSFTGWSAAASLVAGSTYALIARVEGEGAVFWSLATGSPTGGGTVDVGIEGWFDEQLALRVEVAPIPVPAALPLMVSALAGLGLIARRRPGRSAGVPRG